MKKIENIHNNFSTAPWYEHSHEETISVLGVGGIGSNTVYNIVKTLNCEIVLIDPDIVEEHNLGSQFFDRSCLGGKKVTSLKSLLGHFINTTSKISTFTYKIQDLASSIFPITITGFDNMEARKFAFEQWKEAEHKELFIDGRLRATEYEIFTVQNNENQIQRYESTLFNSDEVLSDPCTFKQTSYAGMLIGARITSILVNYLANKYQEDKIYSVPFHIKELLELCYVQIKE